MALSSPLNARLDALVGLANDAGANTSRKELFAALVLGSSMAGDELSAAVHRYRTATVADAFVPGHDKEPFLEPGPSPPDHVRGNSARTDAVLARARYQRAERRRNSLNDP
jgi:hypothetical protein